MLITVDLFLGIWMSKSGSNSHCPPLFRSEVSSPGGIRAEVDFPGGQMKLSSI